MECAIEDFVDWRNKARTLLMANIPPDQVALISENGNHDLFKQEQQCNDANKADNSNCLLLAPTTKTFSISRDFLQRAYWVSHHSASARWQLLYSLAWRLTNENKRLLNNPIDHEVNQFNRWFKAVTRDHHKMKAFVRFQSIKDFTDNCYSDPTKEFLEPESLHKKNAETLGQKNGNQKNRNQKNRNQNKENYEPLSNQEIGNDHFIAWFEPEHFILPLATDFFIKRFNSMSWSILTPHECAHWHEQRLIFTEGATRPPLPQDQTKVLWLQYYGSIFNPARVKVKAMQSEMPKKYWKNLPEAQLIKSLLERATSRVDKMIDLAHS